MSLTIYANFSHAAPVASRTIAVVGLGYIGLPTAAALAQSGHTVIGVDIDPQVVTGVNAGKSHIVEPGLEDILLEATASGRLSAVTVMPEAEVYLIAVPTPVSSDARRAPDLSYVFAAVDAIAPTLKPGALVVLESTCPVGTTQQVIERLIGDRPDLRFPRPDVTDVDVDVVYSPERVIPGRTLHELATNARVLGGTTPTGAARAAEIYRSLTTGELLLTDDRSAEMTKLVENAFRDVNIAFANELSLISERVGVDVWELIALANHHPRVNILQPGAGVGGHCIAIDPWFIVDQAPREAKLIRTAREVNDSKPLHVIARLRELMSMQPDRTLACLGLTYKPNVDDYRESPALEIARQLTREFPGRVFCVDPHAEALLEPRGVHMVELDEALQCQVIASLVAHREFQALPKPERIVVDICGLWG